MTDKILERLVANAERAQAAVSAYLARKAGDGGDGDDGFVPLKVAAERWRCTIAAARKRVQRGSRNAVRGPDGQWRIPQTEL